MTNLTLVEQARQSRACAKNRSQAATRPADADGRAEMREVMSKIDAELAPEVAATTAFRAASDGGGRDA